MAEEGVSLPSETSLILDNLPKALRVGGDWTASASASRLLRGLTRRSLAARRVREVGRGLAVLASEA